MNITYNENRSKENMIVALWGAPRCVTTAFEKTFSQRQDTEIFHEPFSDTYYFSQWRFSNRAGDYEDKLKHDCGTVIREIKAKVQLSPIVFLKDFPFQILPYLDKDVLDFLDSIVNTFIVRHPHEVLASWYKAEEKLTEQEFGGEITEEEFGFNALSRMFEIITEDLKQKPIVVEANRFRRNPEKILNDYCQQIGVTFNPEMLSWKNGRLKQWNPREAKIHNYWHKSLDSSSGINPPTEVDMHIRSEHLDMVEKSVSVYEKLVDYAL